MKKTKLKLVFFCALLLCSLIGLFACGEAAEEVYSVSGAVTIDGEIASGVEVSVGELKTITNENGEFTFDNLTGVNYIKVSADENVYFPSKTIQVYKGGMNVAFEGSVIYSVKGVVISEGVPVPNASIKANGILSISTQTDERGEFVLPNIAGTTTIVAKQNSEDFFEKTVDKSNADEVIVINGYCNVFGKVVCDGEPVEGVVISDGSASAKTDQDGNYILNKVRANSVLTASKQGFKFVKTMKVESFGESVDFECFELYSKSGTVKSGKALLENISIKAVGVGKENGDLVVMSKTDADGNYVINGLYGEVEISAISSDYNFNSNDGINFNGCYTVNVKTNLGNGIEIEVLNEKFITQNGIVTIENVTDSDIIDPTNSAFKIGAISKQNSGKIRNYNYKFEKFYELDVKVLCGGIDLENATTYVNGEIYTGEKLFGQNSITVECDGYFIQGAQVSSENNYVLVFNALKYYTAFANGLPEDSKIFVNDELIASGSTFSVSAYKAVTIKITFNKFEDVVFVFNADTDKDFTSDVVLTYKEGIIEKTGTVLSDSIAVEGVEISCDGITTVTDENGYYLLKAVSKDAQITAKLQGYAFVPNENGFEGFATYTISGTVKSGLEVLSNVEVLISNEKGLNVILTTNEFGVFEFDGAFSECAVQVINNDEIDFGKLTVTETSQADFDGSFDVSVSVFEFGVGVSGTFSFAGQTINTDENGHAQLSGITKSDLLNFSSDEYKVLSSEVSSEIGIKRFEIQVAKYFDLSGKVSYGGEALASVQVSLNGDTFDEADFGSVSTDELGNYSFRNVYGSVTVEFVKDGFVINNLTLDKNNSMGNVDAFKIFAINGMVIFNNSAVSDAIVRINGVDCELSANGEFSVSNLYGKVSYEITHPNLVGVSGFFTENNSKPIAVILGKEETGRITTGSLGVSGANVSLEKTSLTELSEYEIITSENLFAVTDEFGNFKVVISEENYDNYVLNVEKENYQFEISGFDAIATYKVFGNTVFSNEDGTESYISNVSIVVKDENSERIVFSDENGYFECLGLTGVVWLMPNKDLQGNKVDQALEFAPSFIKVNGEFDYLQFIHGSYELSGRVVSGGLAVSNALVEIGSNKTYTDENGYFMFEALSGTKEVLVSKDGYVFESKFVSSSTKEVVLNGTYSIDGKAFTDSIILEGVEVLLNGNKVCMTDAFGMFTLSGLSGENEIRFVKNGFNDEVFVVENPTSLNSNISYDYIVRAVTGNVVIPGAEVFVNGIKAGITDEHGSIVLKIYGQSEILVIKNGYNFEKSFIVSEPDFELVNDAVVHGVNDVNSTYTFEGYVKTGNAVISNVEIVLGSVTVYTDANGYFVINNISGARNVSFFKLGCDFSGAIKNVNGYIDEFELNVSYSVNGIITNGENVFVSDVEVSINGEVLTQTDINGSFSLSGLYGESCIEFVKQGYDFGGQITVVGGLVDCVVDSSYTVTGFIGTDGIGIDGVHVSVGGKATTTDVNGEFTVSGIKGECEVKYSLVGHSFTGITSVSKPTHIEVESTYSVAGLAMSGDVILSGVQIFDNGTPIFETGNDGRFLFENLSGQHVFTFAKEGYTIASITLSKADLELVTNAVYSIVGTVMTGDVAVGGVSVSTEFGSVNTANDGSFTLNGISGTVDIEFSKNGYEFNSYKANSPSSINIDGTYTFEGTIKSGNVSISDAVIKIDGFELANTNSLGKFEISGIKGSVQVEILKDGYTFEYEKTLNKYSKVTISASYDVVLNFVSGSQKLSGMSVNVGGNSYVTDSNGQISINSVVGQKSVSIEKLGYTFTKQFNGQSDNDLLFFESGEYVFSGTYEVHGTVRSGSLFIPSVEVSNGTETVVADQYGEFVFKGLTGENKLQFTKQGYSITDLTVSDYSVDLVANATYKVSIVFTDKPSDGLPTSSISVTFKREGGTDETVQAVNGKVEILGISGKITFKYDGHYLFFNNADYGIYESKGYDYFKSNGYMFTSTSLQESSELEIGVKYDGYYYVKGKITGSGVAMGGISVSAGGQSTVTGNDGTFEFAKAFDKYTYPSLTPTYSIPNNTGGFSLTYNNPTATLSSTAKPDSTISLTCLASGTDLGSYLVWKAYENLKTVESFESTVTGKVDADAPAIAGDCNQKVTGYKKKDSSGNIETLYLNYGKDVNILGIVVHPQTGLYTFSNVDNNNNVFYKYTKTVSSSLVPNWNDTRDDGGSGWTDSAGYDSKFYVSYTNLARYVISKTNITSATLSGNGTITVSVNYKYDGNGYAISQYYPQMKKFSGQEPTITQVTGTYTIDSNGNLSKVKMQEGYWVKQAGFTVTCVSTLDETFTMNKFTGNLTVQS